MKLQRAIKKTSNKQESEFLHNPLKKDLCIVSPRPNLHLGETGLRHSSPTHPIAKLSRDFTLHIK